MYSELSLGTTIRLYLPRSRAAVATRHGPVAEHLPLGRPDETISAAVDYHNLRVMVETMRTDLGHTRLTSTNRDPTLAI